MKEYECKKTLACERCGDCCRFRPPKTFSEFEDHSIRKVMYGKTGIIYPYHMDRFTISITGPEKEVMEKRAKEKDLNLTILPKKVVIKEGKIIVLDWFLDHDQCPFLNDTNICSIYEARPLICQVFPRNHYSKEEEEKLILMKGDIVMEFDQAVDTVKTAFESHTKQNS